MDYEKEAIKIGKQNGAVYLLRKPDWKGCVVYGMYFQNPDEPPICIGVPVFIVFIGGKPVVTDENLSFAYMDYINAQNGGEDESDEEFEPIMIR